MLFYLLILLSAVLLLRSFRTIQNEKLTGSERKTFWAFSAACFVLGVAGIGAHLAGWL